MTAFAEIDGTKFVTRQIGRLDPPDFVGPDDETPQVEPGMTCRKLTANLDRNAPTLTSRLQWLDADTAPVWVETVALSIRSAAAIAKTYADIDSIYADAVGSRTEEYKDAETDARAFKAAGYTGTASGYVHDFAVDNPTGAAQTDQWAADQIIARADAFAAAKLSMRSQRFASQAAMRTAAASADLDAAVANWKTYIATLRQNLGLPPAP